MPKVWYRYENGRVEGEINLMGEGPSRAFAYLHTFEVEKETPKGVWLKNAWGYSGRADGRRFVLRDSYKQWACQTIEAARNSYRRRRKSQIKLLEAQLKTAQTFAAATFEDKPYSVFSE